jgi:hypothetical protein
MCIDTFVAASMNSQIISWLIKNLTADLYFYYLRRKDQRRKLDYFIIH